MQWRAVTAAVVFVGLCVDAVRADESLAPQVLKDIKAATVFIKLSVNTIALSSGSGFVIRQDDDTTLIATNAHVIELPELLGAGPIPDEITGDERKALLEIRKRTAGGRPEVSVVFQSGTKDESTLSAEIIAQNSAQDLAILRVRGASIKPRPIAFEQTPQLRETMTVFAFGFPFGASLAFNQRNPAVTVTRAAVASVRDDEMGDPAVVQIDGSLNPGNSGGPIVDSQGKLIAVSVRSILGSGIGFGVPTARLDRTLKGEVVAATFKARRVGEDKAVVDVRVQVADPLNRIKSVSLNYLSGPAPAGDSNQPHAPLPGGTTLALQREGQVATGQFELPLKTGAALRFAAQPTMVDESGQTVVLAPQTVDEDFATADRKVYAFASTDAKIKGRIVQAATGWIENSENRTNPQKPLKIVVQFTELSRTDEYIELRNTKGAVYRLFPDRIDILQKSGQWATGLGGSWVKFTEGDARIAAQSTLKPAAVATAPVAPATPAASVRPEDRQVWRFTNQKNKSGTFTRTETAWVEDNELIQGNVSQTEHHEFQVVAENKDFIELIDDRKISVRLYADRAEFKLAARPWTRLYQGQWDAPAGAADEPAAAAPAAGERTVWKYENQKNASGTIRRTADGWIEEKETKIGTELRKEKMTYRETAATDDYIEMIDDRRNVTNRVYAEHTEWRFGKGPWNREFRGSWVSE